MKASLTTYASAPKSDAEAMYRYLQALRELGWEPVAVDDGGHWESVKEPKPWTDDEIVAVLSDVDISRLRMKHPAHETLHTLVFVTGNDPTEVLADHTVGREGDLWDVDLEAAVSVVNPDEFEDKQAPKVEAPKVLEALLHVSERVIGTEQVTLLSDGRLIYLRRPGTGTAPGHVELDDKLLADAVLEAREKLTPDVAYRKEDLGWQ